MIAELKNIGLTINRQAILKDINLQLKSGEITTLIGPNGGGKTSMARILLGILKPTHGQVFKNPKLRIGYMPQKIEIDKTIPLTALDFIQLVEPNPKSSWLSNQAPANKIKFDKNFEKFCAKLHLEKILEKQIHSLSGGQLQKVLLLRSLMNQPELLVLDEPTQYMDINATQEFYQIIEEIRSENNCAILLISHDLHAVMQKTDLVFCINHHVCCHGSPESVNKHPEYISLFGNMSNMAIYQHRHDHKH